MRRTVLMTFMVAMLGFVSMATETNSISINDEYTFVSYKPNPFCMAIIKGDLETVKKMIELGSKVNEKSSGMTPLMYAAKYNRTDIIKLLIAKGANIKTRSEKGYTAMKFAKLSNAKDAMALLEQEKSSS